MRIRVYWMIFVLVFLVGSQARSQYLEVRRSATVRDQPAGNATVMERVEAGAYLKLLDSGKQQNGYYHVKAKSVAGNGWIYRTLVRRYEGKMPGAFALLFDPIPEGYYTGASTLTGTALKSALNHIISHHYTFTYGAVWDYLKKTDVDTTDTTRVIGIYSGFSMSADSEYAGGKGWTREHVWAKSFGNFGTVEGPGTDLHHLRVEDVSTNSARNNRTFDVSDVPYVDDKGMYQGTTRSRTSTTSWTWEPRDDVKGDVARMLFYMAVRYEGEDGEPNLELVDAIVPKNSKLPTHGRLSTLLRWHAADPVDDYERYRNYVVFGLQHNRNPFIDHPEFVAKIWGD